MVRESEEDARGFRDSKEVHLCLLSPDIDTEEELGLRKEMRETAQGAPEWLSFKSL